MPSRWSSTRQDNGDEQYSTNHKPLLPDGGNSDHSAAYEKESYRKWDPSVDEEPEIDPPIDGQGPHAPEETRSATENREIDSNREISSRTDGDETVQPNPSKELSPEKAGHRDQLRDQPADEFTDPASEDSSTSIDQLPRRRLLFGGVGAAIAGAVGWWYLSGNRTAAEGVAAEYVSAVGDNDWNEILSLYHDDAPLFDAIEEEGIDEYQEFLAAEDRLELYEALDPSIEELYEWDHIPDLSGDAADSFHFAPDEAGHLDEWKHINVIVTIDPELLQFGFRGEEAADALAAGETVEAFSVSTVLDSNQWFIWEAGMPI